MDLGSTLKLVVCATAILLMSPSVLSANHEQLSNAGTQYVVSTKREGNVLDRPTFYVTTQEDGDVGFTVSDGTSSLSYSVNSAARVALDMEHDNDFANFDDGILLSSDDGVSKLIVVGLRTIYNALSGDTFTLFPVQKFPSYTYYAMSIETQIQNEHRSFVHLVSTRNDTTLTITPSQTLSLLGNYGCSGAVGESCSLTLNKLKTLNLRSNFDLTGTKIVSDNPMSVFSGHECAQVPINLISNCKPLIEQIPPVLTWGKTFLVGPLLGHQKGEWYKVISAKADTTVNVYCVSSGESYSDNFVLPTEGSARFFSVGTNRRCSMTADKPVLVMLFATNTAGDSKSNTFMSLVPPVKQYISPVYLTLEPSVQDNTVSITIPATSCPNSQCSLLVDNDITINAAASSQPIYCSKSEVCGYVLSHSLPAGVHTLKLSESSAPIGVISYTESSTKFGFGTVGSLALNNIAVDVVLAYDGLLEAGEKLVLTCRVGFQEDFGAEITTTLKWLKGEEDTELKTTSVEAQNPRKRLYVYNHTLETLSLEDSDVYRCEVTLSSNGAGVIATASDSMTLSVVGYGYIQLQFLGVPKCSDWLTESEERVKTLSVEVAALVSTGCNCHYSSAYISSPTLQCSTTGDPDSSHTLLYQARVTEGGDTPINYQHVVTILEDSKGTSFSFMAILLTVGSSESCGVSINGFQQAPRDCFYPPTDSDTETPSTGGVEGNTEGNSGIIVAGVVGMCVVILVFGLVLIVVGVVSRSRHHGISNQRPKSIHLHHRLPQGGDSVTSFSPTDSGSPNSPVYIQKDSNPSSPAIKTTFSMPQNGIGSGTHSRSPSDDQEQEENYRTMKANLSAVELLPAISHV